MNYGENIRNGLTNLGMGLTNLGKSLENMHKRHHDWDEESKALGLISDDDKIRMLKRELYCEARSGVSDSFKLQKLTSAIEILEEIKQSEFNRKQAAREQRLSLPSQLEATCSLLIMLSITVVVGSYLATYQCGNYQSRFCSNARIIPTQIELFFKD